MSFFAPQAAFDGADCSDPELLSLWESFQPQVVIVAKVKTSGSQENYKNPNEPEKTEIGVKEENVERKEDKEEQFGERKRRVRFAPDDQLTQVHILDDEDEGNINVLVDRSLMGFHGY